VPHDLVVRPLTVHQYRLGQDVQLERTDTGNKFTFTDGSAQPGEGGDKIGYLETILGFDYKFEPDFPTLAGKESFSGGSSGINATAAEKAAALDSALRELPSVDYGFLVPSGLKVDDMKDEPDPVTGVVDETPVDVLGVLQDHQERKDFTGASGVVFASVSEMEPSDAGGRYASSKKMERSEEILGTGGTGEITTGSIIQEESRPQFMFFDAPVAMSLNGQDIRTDTAAFWAGVRAAVPNDTALYEVELPKNRFQPVYKYDVERRLPEKLGNEGRVNTWDITRGDVKLATEQTGAGQVQSSGGSPQPSNLQSGVVMLATQQYRRNLEESLSNLIGGMKVGDVDTLRATAATMVRESATRTTGVTGLNKFEPQRDIQIQAEGGSAVGLYVDVQALVMGELTRVDLTVGSITQTEAGRQEAENPIPQAQ
jgi:hypothetical protein